ncbi:MAG: hypothetical protein AB8G95_06005 [Anaerolineae bacterium]
MTNPTPLLMENVTVFADLNTALVSYTYRNVISERETFAVYEWMKTGLSTWFKEENFRGAIFDFRDVTKFSFGTVAVAKEESSEANKIADLSIFPVALMVNNTRQEVKVRMSMLGGDSNRKHLARKNLEALDFINEWNLQHNRKFDIPEEKLALWPAFVQ